MIDKKIVIIIPILILFIIGGFWFFKSSDKGGNTISFPQNPNLILNTDKSYYSPGEEVYIQITSLDASGKAICNSNLELTSANSQIPNSKYQIPISNSPTCGKENNSSNHPEYTAFFKPEKEGNYTITLRNKDTGEESQIQTRVGNSPTEISVSRWSATRININENSRYPMVIKVVGNTDFSGTITDSLPDGFEFAWFGVGKVNEINGRKNISWQISLKKGETMELKYEYIPKYAGSCNFLLGPLNLGSKTIDSGWSVTSGSGCNKDSKTTGYDVNMDFISKHHILSTISPLARFVLI